MMTSITLAFIAGFAKAVMDTLEFHFEQSLYAGLNDQFWNPKISWQNKYSDAVALTRKKWFGIIPIPDLLTDGWHLFQSLFLTCIFAAIIFYAPITSYKIIDFIILRAIFGFAFVLFYNKLLLK